MKYYRAYVNSVARIFEGIKNSVLKLPYAERFLNSPTVLNIMLSMIFLLIYIHVRG